MVFWIAACDCGICLDRFTWFLSADFLSQTLNYEFFSSYFQAYPFQAREHIKGNLG